MLQNWGPEEHALTGAKVPEKSFAPPKTPFCTGAKWGFGWCKRLFGDLCSRGPKDLLHPPLSAFGNFPFSVNCPGLRLPKAKLQSQKKVPGAAETGCVHVCVCVSARALQ